MQVDGRTGDAGGNERQVGEIHPGETSPRTEHPLPDRRVGWRKAQVVEDGWKEDWRDTVRDIGRVGKSTDVGLRTGGKTGGFALPTRILNGMRECA